MAEVTTTNVTVVVPPPVNVTVTAPVTSVVTTDGTEPIAVIVQEAGPGIPGPAGVVGGAVEYVAGEDIPVMTVVSIHADGLAYRASSASAFDAEGIVGVASISAVTSDVVRVQAVGDLYPATPIPVGPLYVGIDGALTTNPGTGVFQLLIGSAATTTRFQLRLGLPIFY